MSTSVQEQTGIDNPTQSGQLQSGPPVLQPEPFATPFTAISPCPTDSDNQMAAAEKQQSYPPLPSSSRRFPFLAVIVLLLLVLGCSASDLLPQPTPPPVPTRPLEPTFTATATIIRNVVIVTPPMNGTPGVIIIPPGEDPNKFIPLPPTATPSPTLIPGQPTSPLDGQPAIPPTPTPLPTETATPTLTSTPTLTPTPFIVVESGVVSLRTGPGVEYPLVAQLGPGIPVALIGRTPEGTWYQICCVNGVSLWVASTHVLVNNDQNSVALVGADQPPPLPTPTLIPTATGTPTLTPTATRYPFEVARGPEFFPTDNEFVTIWVKIYTGPPGGPDEGEVALAGYFLKVKFEGVDRPNTGTERPSADQFSFSASPGAGNRVKYNYKYEFTPPEPTPVPPATQNPVGARLPFIGTGTWTITLVDGAGNQFANPVTFTTAPSNPNREVYIAWIRTR